MRNALLALSLLVALSGCSSYVNSPVGIKGRAEAQSAFSDPLIRRAYNARPAMRFPATIAVAPQNGTAVQQLRNLDALGKLDPLKKLPQIAGIVTVNSIVMSQGYSGDENKQKPIWNKSDLLLREAAARLHADAVLLLQLETHVTDGRVFAPLSTLTLGMFPNNRAEIVVTGLAALIDTKTGYYYGVVERSAGKTTYTISWDDDTRDRAVRKTEQAAMEKLMAEFPDFWARTVQAHRK